MESEQQYSMHLEPRYQHLEVMDVHALAEACRETWYNETLCQVNSSVIRLGVFQGSFHWHHHDKEDEFFYVVEGELLIDLDGTTVHLFPRQGYVVPKGVRHRTRAPERTVVLMIESVGIQPTGD